MTSKRLLTVVGGQFGSEAKGHVAAQLAAREIRWGKQVWAVRVAGHNAGHTSLDSNGVAYPLRTIPCMAVVDPNILCFIAAGSELSMEVLESEIAMIEAGGHEIRHRLFIDPEATVIDQEHIDAETDQTLHQRLGSTGKGVGAARAARALRKARRWGDVYPYYGNQFSSEYMFRYDAVPPNTTIILEGTQGFGLGLHAGMYPYCTSSNTRSIDFLAMAGIDHALWVEHGEYTPWVVCRTYPIRVAGNSGPLNDVTWDELSDRSDGYIKPERTTVTKLIRRIGEFDQEMVERALYANGGPEIAQLAITFADYIDPKLAGVESSAGLVESNDFEDWIEMNTSGVGWVGMVTTGPDTCVWL